MVESAYIHIPFCRQKCRYCSFISFPALERKEEYLKALHEQISAQYNGEPLKTLYFGGGTPSLLSVDEISALSDRFNFALNTEVTLELNPETVNTTYFQALSATRINRLSIGAQSFNDKILAVIGRKHSAQDIERVVKAAQNAGFNNISLDFIYGLPNQKLENFISDLKSAVSLNIQHISLYGLKIEEGCTFYKNPPENLADDELQAQMYLAAIETLTSLGFEHYEISNFARPNHYSHHNTTYWKNEEYYGFGLGAHGYTNGSRYSNTETLKTYLQNPKKKVSSHKLSNKEKLEEEIFLGFRLTQGINVKKINKKFGIDFEKKYSKILKKYTASNHIKSTDNTYFFTPSGFLISNYILADFLD